MSGWRFGAMFRGRGLGRSCGQCRASLLTIGAAVALAGCGVPPLHRSVVVETNGNGVPVHASGHMGSNRYTVARGDTLYSIAFRANVDYHDLARWNGIRAPYVIQPGQVLRLTPPRRQVSQVSSAPVFQPVSKPAAPAPDVHAPVTSSVAGAAASTAADAASTVVVVAGSGPKTGTASDADSSASIPAGATRRVNGVTWRWPATGKLLNQFRSDSAMPGVEIAGEHGDPVRAAASGVVVYSGNGLVGYGELIVLRHDNHYMSAYGYNSKRLVSEGQHVKAGQVIALMGSNGAPRTELEFQVRYKGKPVNPLDYLPKR